MARGLRVALRRRYISKPASQIHVSNNSLGQGLLFQNVQRERALVRCDTGGRSSLWSDPILMVAPAPGCSILPWLSSSLSDGPSLFSQVRENRFRTRHSCGYCIATRASTLRYSELCSIQLHCGQSKWQAPKISWLLQQVIVSTAEIITDIRSVSRVHYLDNTATVDF